MADKHTTPNQLYLQTIFKYEDGKLYWNVKKFKVKFGSLAGCYYKNGYVRIRLDKKFYLAHRLIFMMFHGYIPEYIDHINNDPHDNRIENLRPATKIQNQQNIRINKRNTSGVKGVCWNNYHQKYLARCAVDGERIHLGYFKKLADAKKAIEKFRKQHHGEFARNA